MAAATPGCSFASAGGAGQYRDRICWINLADFRLSSVAAWGGAGQTVTQTLPGGYRLSFNMVRTSGTTSTVAPAATPTWSDAATGQGSAIGNTAYLGIAGQPVWYQQSGSGTYDTFRIRNVVLTSPTGATVSNFALVAADGEATDAAGLAEGMRFTAYNTTISVLENVPSGVGNLACNGGLTTNSTAIDCIGGGTNPGALVVQAPYTSSMYMDVGSATPTAAPRASCSASTCPPSPCGRTSTAW